MSDATYEGRMPTIDDFCDNTDGYICQTCGKKVSINEYYGSGRFCCRKCSNAYSSSFANAPAPKQKKIEALMRCKKSTKPCLSIPKKDFLAMQEKWNLKDIRLQLNITHGDFQKYVSLYNLKENSKFIEPNRFRVIDVCRRILDKPIEQGSITYEDLKIVQDECYRLMFVEGWGSERVSMEYLGLPKRNSRFVSYCIGVPLRSLSQANIMVNQRLGYYDNKDEEELYKLKCGFRFSSNLYPYLPGYELIKKHGWYDKETNTNGVTRDHMLSKHYGFVHNIDPYLISHPANCMFMLFKRNSSKREECSLSLQELIERVEWFNETILYKESNLDLLNGNSIRYNPSVEIFNSKQLKHFSTLSMI